MVLFLLYSGTDKAAISQTEGVRVYIRVKNKIHVQEVVRKKNGVTIVLR